MGHESLTVAYYIVLFCVCRQVHFLFCFMYIQKCTLNFCTFVVLVTVYTVTRML